MPRTKITSAFKPPSKANEQKTRSEKDKAHVPTLTGRRNRQDNSQRGKEKDKQLAQEATVPRIPSAESDSDGDDVPILQTLHPRKDVKKATESDRDCTVVEYTDGEAPISFCFILSPPLFSGHANICRFSLGLTSTGDEERLHLGLHRSIINMCWCWC
jgi:hypothetical protein